VVESFTKQSTVGDKGSVVRHQAEIRGEIKNHASVSLLNFRRCHGFSFRQFFECALARGLLSPQSVKRAANGRVTDSDFKKSYDHNKFQK
jgi:hypothetical protein